MVGVTKLRIKFGHEISVKSFRLVPGVSNCSNASKLEESIGGGGIKAVNHSKKRGPIELEEVQATKKQKLDRALSSQCIALLRLLMEHQLGWIFNEPVDPVKLKIPDYFSVISKPMDLGTIKLNLLKNVYRNVDEFAADVRLTFTNAMRYNPPENSVHIWAKELKGIFEVRWDSLKKKKFSELSGIEVREGPERKSHKVDCIRQSSPQTSSSSGRFSVETKPAKEKSENVSLLLKPTKGQIKNDTPVDTPKALATQSSVKKLKQGLGVSATAKNPGKGSAPTAACKCSSCGMITCICLKSCNSSGSDVSSLTDCQLMNTSGAEATESDLHSNWSVNSRNEKNGCVSSQLDKPTNSALLDNATELKTTVPAMPPLPAEKALRAAILKGQFAETILRAKHKIVLDQSHKADRISIRIEREQMERTQREEKARIEAEMRAAKIAARMRAENELKQKRESERLVLEKMKNTDDFNEYSFLTLERDMINLCGRSYLTRRRLVELGLFLKDDDECPEETVSEVPNATRMDDDLEEGEIL